MLHESEIFGGCYTNGQYWHTYVHQAYNVSIYFKWKYILYDGSVIIEPTANKNAKNQIITLLLWI